MNFPRSLCCSLPNVIGNVFTIVLAVGMMLISSQLFADVVAHYHFDETSGSTAFDSVGAINGTLNGDAAFVSGGISGNAISMSIAGNGFVDMGNNFGFTSGDFSVVAWAKIGVGDTSTDYFVTSKHRSTQVAGHFIGLNTSSTYGATNKSYFYDSNPSPPATPVSTTSVNDGNWHQIVGVYTAGGLAEIFVDGAGVEDSKAAGGINATTASFLIGGITNSGGTPFGTLNGMVDEVQIYDEALSSADVQFLFLNPSFTTAVPRTE